MQNILRAEAPVLSWALTCYRVVYCKERSGTHRVTITTRLLCSCTVGRWSVVRRQVEVSTLFPHQEDSSDSSPFPAPPVAAVMPGGGAGRGVGTMQRGRGSGAHCGGVSTVTRSAAGCSSRLRGPASQTDYPHLGTRS